MSPVSCVPKDDFHVVLRCDGTGAILPTPCGYTKKIGTTFGDELSETISISSTIGKKGLKECIQSLFSPLLEMDRVHENWSKRIIKSISHESFLFFKRPSILALSYIISFNLQC